MYTTSSIKASFPEDRMNTFLHSLLFDERRHAASGFFPGRGLAAGQEPEKALDDRNIHEHEIIRQFEDLEPAFQGWDGGQEGHQIEQRLGQEQDPE